ncbi:MAG TPA: FAD-dependent monooxygenase [Novimethylophilus sp.]|uniref:NAD(P)/FAD-dependent oxidoreductase n=1 Tax=Novimethylophilus sp. TaxID=2137426 RepID=UPI002F3F834A
MSSRRDGNKMPHYDALVIGGGPAGATAALLLARAGCSVGVIEQAVFPRRKVCGEFLSAGSLPLLRELGVADAFDAEAGPEVREIGLFAGRAMLKAPMPQPAKHERPWGRALSRERLDTLLLDHAQQAGAEVWQPWKAVGLQREQDSFSCSARNAAAGETATLAASIIIAAHGSWEPGKLLTQALHRPAHDADLFGFKAHFSNAALAPGLMPLLVFAGGYGGMVHTGSDRVNLSCCIRRDRLARVRQQGDKAGDAVLRHIQRCCLGVELALKNATLEHHWLSAGPINPGIREAPLPGIFLAGNTAGEAHPIIAEGISIAMQSAWLLSQALIPGRQRLADEDFLREAASSYRSAWRRHFSTRIRASALFAQLAMRPLTAALLLPAFRLAPALLTSGARLAGKAVMVV